MSLSPAEIFKQAFVLNQEHVPSELVWHHNWSALWQIRWHLIDRARAAARQRGRSYRGFRVGAAAFLTSAEPEALHALGRSGYAIYTGANLKLERDARNTCAEQEVVAQIRQQGHLFPAERMLALVVAGEPQDEPDGESGVMTCTLHPCRHCRRLLREIPEMRPDTIIITVKLEVDFWKIHSFQEILELHGIAT